MLGVLVLVLRHARGRRAVATSAWRVVRAAHAVVRRRWQRVPVMVSLLLMVVVLMLATAAAAAAAAAAAVARRGADEGVP